MATRLRFGLLLPHFGEHGSVRSCVEGAKQAEAYGFDSIWVRDHLVFRPHGVEGADNTHIESLQVLSAVATVTKNLLLGTAMAICHRHPIHLAQSFAGLSVISRGRIIMGLGIGGFAHEFAAAGLPSTLEHRAELAKCNVDICRRLWAGKKLNYHDEYFDFDQVQLKPLPVRPIPVWVGGATAAACRRAAEYGDGWLPARITLATFEKRVRYLRELSRTAGRGMPTTAVMPYTSVAIDKATAVRHIDLEAILDEARSFTSWVRPASGSINTLDDIQGALLAGAPADIIRDVRAYQRAGLEHLVFDLRLRYADWHEQIALLGREVLPALRD